MINIYKLKCFDVDNYNNETYMMINLNSKNFEKMLQKCVNKSNKDLENVSRYSHFMNILSLLKKRGGKIVNMDNSTYYLSDDCPIPNTSFWEKEFVIIKEIENGSVKTTREINRENFANNFEPKNLERDNKNI